MKSAMAEKFKHYLLKLFVKQHLNRGNFTFVKDGALQMQGLPLRANAFLSSAKGSKILCRFRIEVFEQLNNNASRCKTNHKFKTSLAQSG